MNTKSKIAACILPQGRFSGGRPAAEAFARAIMPMAIVDPDLRLLDCNNAFFKAFNNDGRSGNPAQLERYLDEADLWQIREQIEQLQQGQSKPGQKIDLVTNEMQFLLQPLMTSGAGQILISFEAKSLSEQGLEDTRQRLQMVVEGIAVGLIVVAAETKCIVDINTLALQMFGRSREEMTNKTYQQFFCLGDDDNGSGQLEGDLSDSGKRMLRAPNGSQRPVSFVVKRSNFKGRDYLLISMTDISSQHSAELEASHLANFDPTTDLPNRALLLDRLNQALDWSERAQSSVSLLLLDIDKFKDLNDSLDHASGDRLLALFGERIRSCVRRSDTVARFGADEFAVILSDMGSEQQVASLARKILAAVSEPCTIDGKQYRLTQVSGSRLSHVMPKMPRIWCDLQIPQCIAPKKSGAINFSSFHQR